MKKYIALALAVLLLLGLAACSTEKVVLDESKTYEITKDIHTLDIEINAADFVIEYGEACFVESNLKYLSVSQEDGVLTIAEAHKNSINYTSAKLKLCLPKDIELEKVEISTGAAKLTAESLSAKTMKLMLGAGTAHFARLDASSEINIQGGAGAVTVDAGTLNNLTLMLGAGKLDMTAALLGESNLEFGVGQAKLTLTGSRDDYKFDIKKGVGSIIFDGETIADSYGGGNGANKVKIEGGVGAAEVAFQENKAR